MFSSIPFSWEIGRWRVEVKLVDRKHRGKWYGTYKSSLKEWTAWRVGSLWCCITDLDAEVYEQCLECDSTEELERISFGDCDGVTRCPSCETIEPKTREISTREYERHA